MTFVCPQCYLRITAAERAAHIAIHGNTGRDWRELYARKVSAPFGR